MRNADVADLLDSMADLLAIKSGDHFRVQAYQEAARTIRSHPEPIEEVWDRGELEAIPGIGPSIAEKVAEFLRTGESRYLAQLKQEVPRGAITLMQVPGLGPKRAMMLAKKLGITSIGELIQAAETHRIRELPGMGAKSEAALLREARRATERGLRIPLYIALPLAESMAGMLRDHPAVGQIEPGGSVRRRQETVGDIDLLVASSDADAVFDAVAQLPIVEEVLARGGTKASVLTWTSLQVDLRVVPPESWGAALQYFTGNKAHNIHLRNLAIDMGLKLNEYGVFRLDTDQRLAGTTEADVYEALGLTWMPPEIRQDNGEIEAAASGTLPDLITLEDIKGDFHLHSTYSDGKDSIEAMALAAQGRGYAWMVLTDHSYGLPVTQGLTKEKALRQRDEIADLNRRLAPFRILQGVELEIRKDGTLDFDDEFLATFDIVGVSLHQPTRDGGEQNTRRILKALKHRLVMGLNHPTGQVIGKRGPYDVDVVQVIGAATAMGKALEMNGSERLDLAASLARQARDRGAVFTLSSDAHSTAALANMQFAVSQARRAWLEKRHVLNTLSADDLVRRYGAGQRQWRAA